MASAVEEERRFVLRLYEYWQTVRGEGLMPAPADMRLDALGPDADFCALITLAGRAEDAVLSAVGANLKPKAWDDIKGRQLSSSPADEPLQVIYRHMGEVLSRVTPVSRGGHFTIRGTRVLGRAILLPLSDNGRKLTHVLAGVNYKEAEPAVNAFAVAGGEKKA